MGSPDPEHGRQLNGMGGGVSSLSKICVVGSPSPAQKEQGIDVEYTFVQVGIRDTSIDYSGNCGNLSSMIGVFAIDEGLYTPPSLGTHATVRSFNTNTQKIIDTTFPISAADPPTPNLETPETAIAGVPGIASAIVLEFVNPAGARTGKLLPTGSPVDELTISPPSRSSGEISIRCSCVDATNPTVFVSQVDLAEFLPIAEYIQGSAPAVGETLERIRRAAAVTMGLDPSAQAQPKIAIIGEPSSTEDRAQGVDVVMHALSMCVLHKAVPMTVGLCAGVASNIENTLVWEVVRKAHSLRGGEKKKMVRIRHPSGVVDVGAQFSEDGDVKSAKVVRTVVDSALMVHLILTSSYTNEVSTLTFDPEASSIEVTSSVTVGHHPSWITFYPEDHSLVFTGLEQTDGKVVALKFDQEGKGEVVAEASSGGADPCSLVSTKNTLFVANYSAGVLSQLPISPNEPYILASSPTKIQLKGTGPNASRQEGSHPHQVIIHEENDELFVPDLGADLVQRYNIADNGSLSHLGQIQHTLGGGPRHVAFYDGHLYTLLELTSVLVKHTLPPLPALPKFVKSTPTMSHVPAQPTDMLAAEILIPTPNTTYPVPYLYLSNRNDPSPEGDIISIFSIAGPDSLELVAEVRSGLQHLRGMVFGGPDDKWLVAGGVNGGGVKIFERVDGGRGLKVVAENSDVQAPTGFLWK
ncbi:hypothetical protein DXG03_008727 [Asterophora parasitica]|uniref:Phytochrome chromophore attachment site domain-containing protein n=1 Tax=Asterophora parasitica TaxID=117018 RepID=A0A9P7KCM2_9AGAR|nr:hypothetical protein DXG03_008727 [Asterophora parasitica]